MDKFLYVAMTGARENMKAQQVHSNNLANVNTTGFKADLEQARSMRVIGEGLESRVYSMGERPGTNTESGTLFQTDRSLDVAIDGEGWIAVLDQEGQEAYTRSGSLQVLSTGELVTSNGNPVMGANGAPIVLPPSSKVNVANDGTITVFAIGDPATEPAVIDRIKLVTLEKGSFFKGLNGMMVKDDGLIADQNIDVRLRSGYLETSNVNAINELTSIISLSKQFEMQIKMMKTAEEISSSGSSILRMS